MIIFEVEDITGRIIYLTKERWRHIIHRHPLLFNQIESIKGTIITPLAIINSLSDENIRYYYTYNKKIKSREKYLLIIIKYLNGNGFIITSYYTQRIISK